MNKNIAKAVRLYENAMELIEEAQEIFKEEGITVNEPNSNYYRGKVKDRPPMFNGLEIRKTVGHIKVVKMNFFQLKDVTEDGLYLK